MSPNQKLNYSKNHLHIQPPFCGTVPNSLCKSNNTNVFKTNIKNYIFDSSNHPGSVGFIILLISHFLLYSYDIRSIFLVYMLLCYNLNEFIIGLNTDF
jgi:hypothetical protein